MTLVSTRPLTMLALLASLGACSGGGGGGGGGGGPTAFDDYLSEADALLAEVIDEENTSQDSLPTGEAEYNGVIILGNAEDEGGVAGDLRLTVDFADLDVGGSVTNVADSDGRTYAGTLDVGEDYAPGASYVDPTVDQNDGWLFGADFGGALSQGGDTYLVDGYLDGGIAGPDGEYAGGEAYAESCTVSIGCTDYFGAFIAEGGAASP